MLSLLLFTLSMIHSTLATPSPQQPGRPIFPSAENLLPTPTRPYTPLVIANTTYLSSLNLSDLAITALLPSTRNKSLPASPNLRPIDPSTAILLLNTLITTFSPFQPDGVADYATIGPESSLELAGLEARAVVKQLVLPLNRSSNDSGNGTAGAGEEEADVAGGEEARVQVGAMKNREVAYAAQIVRWMYNERIVKREGGWRMCNLMRGDKGKGMAVRNCTGVMLVQRDLW